MNLKRFLGYYMRTSKKRTLFIYYGLHPSHKSLAKTLKADFFPAPKVRSDSKNPIAILKWTFQTLSFLIKVPKNYDVYFCESTYIFPVLAKKFGLIKKDAKIVNILASPLLYYMKTNRITGLRRRFGLRLLKEVDIFVCIGKMEEDLIKYFVPDAKTIVAYPFINPNMHKKLSTQKNKRPALKKHKILFIGKQDIYCKGVDLLIDAFKNVEEKWPDAELNIVGTIKGLNKYLKENKLKKVYILGYIKNVNDLMKVIKESSLYIHMGRGDAFPVSSLEAMFGGLPTIVSNVTGTKEIVYKINNKFVLPLNAKILSDRINQYFNLSSKEKLMISKLFIAKAKTFEKKHIIKKFQRDYNQLLKQ